MAVALQRLALYPTQAMLRLRLCSASCKSSPLAAKLGLPALLQAMSRLTEFSASEVSALVSAFGSEIVRRSLFDDHIFKE